MARPPRLDPPMGWHHVSNRSPADRALFRTDQDRRDFLQLLAPLDPRFGVEVHACALTDAQFHLLLRSRRGGLAAAMRDLQHRWSLLLTHRAQELGPVFQGRYRSRLLDGVHDLAGALAAVPLDPVADGPTPSPSAARWTPLPSSVDQALTPVTATQGPVAMSVRQAPEQAPEPDAEALLERVEAITGLRSDNLGDPRVGSGPNAALHLAIHVLSQRTPLTQRQIGGLLGLTGRQVAWIVAAQARGLRPEVQRLVERFDTGEAKV